MPKNRGLSNLKIWKYFPAGNPAEPPLSISSPPNGETTVALFLQCCRFMRPHRHIQRLRTFKDQTREKGPPVESYRWDLGGQTGQMNVVIYLNDQTLFRPISLVRTRSAGASHRRSLFKFGQWMQMNGGRSWIDFESKNHLVSFGNVGHQTPLFFVEWMRGPGRARRTGVIEWEPSADFAPVRPSDENWP